MNAFAKRGCSCGCSPCTCAPPPDACNDFCVPRPCFFPGQLVTADDLNAVVDYMRARDRLFAKLALGWGILSGLRLLSAGTKNFQFLFNPDLGDPLPEAVRPIFPNPQIVVGSVIRVSPGAALDNQGRALSLCAPRRIDLAELSKGLGVVQELRTCAGWFGTDFCERIALNDITGALYWVVAEAEETPVRPVPGLAGGGACDPEPFCDFTRKLEGVRIRLVPDLPTTYFLHGCLEQPNLPGLEAFLSLVFDMNGDGGGTGSAGASAPEMGVPSGANEAMNTLFSCLGFKLVPLFYEYLSQIAFDTCCRSSAVVLGRVLLATDIDREARAFLGDSPYYTIIDDAFPYRRQVSNVANVHLLRREILDAVQACDEGGTPGSPS